MSFLNPITALIAAGITIPILIGLYFLKLKRRAMVVPSTLLWKKSVQDLQVNSPFQRLRKNLLLLLQLLILAALLLALARPTMHAAARPGQKVAILIDRSASMNATANGSTRLEQAKDKAIELIESLDGGEAMVLSFAESVKVVQQSTGDLPLLRGAVRAITPTDQRSRLGPALKLVQSHEGGGGGGQNMVVYILSDGKIHGSDDPLALSGAELRYIQIGDPQATNNVAIISFAARRDTDKPQLVRIYARLANYGDQAVQTNVTLTVDGRTTRVQAVSLPAAVEEPGTASVQFELAISGSALVHLEQDHRDALRCDDEVQLVLVPAKRLRVLLVTGGNTFLENVIRSVGVKRLVLMSPEKYENQDPKYLARGGWESGGTFGGGEGFDVIVFDGYAPKKVPPVDSLSFGAAPPIEGLALKAAREGDSQAQVILDWDRSDPLMRYVVLDDVVIVRPGRLVVPPAARVLATGLTGPIIASVREDGLQHVVVGFDLLQSYWPLYVSFPVFMTNVVEVLGLDGFGENAGRSYTTGQIAVVPVSSGSEITYTGPTQITRPVRHGEAVLEMFDRVGLYVTRNDAVTVPFDRLAVNLLDPIESDLRIAQTIKVASVDVQSQAAAVSVRREVWRWFAWGALGVLLLEWWVYTRRMHL